MKVSVIRDSVDAVARETKEFSERFDHVFTFCTPREQIVKFQGDYERHVTLLSEAIRLLGGQPPEFSKDFKGYLLEGFTLLRSMTGTEGALKALKSAEEMTNKRYSEARSWNVPIDVLYTIQGNYEDEQRHLSYVNQCINDRVWEVAEAKK